MLCLITRQVQIAMASSSSVCTGVGPIFRLNSGSTSIQHRPVSVAFFRRSSSCPCFSVTSPLLYSSRRKSLQTVSLSAADEAESGPPSPPANNSISKNRRDMLLEYVKTVQPDFMEAFAKNAPPQVIDAMRQTVTNMLGTLPAQFFAVTVTTVAENLAQLMYSVMMTGYMFRNAQFRLELQKSIAQAALPSVSSVKSDPDYAPGFQKKVSGEVIRWHKETGPESMDAAQYVELLENEIIHLQEQLEKTQKAVNGGNELLNYLKTLEPQNIQELTTSAGEDALEAMNTFIQRLVGISDPVQLKKAVTQTSSADMAKLLYWLMVVGYNIRNIEVRYDMERVLGMPAKLAELPPGETV